MENEGNATSLWTPVPLYIVIYIRETGNTEYDNQATEEEDTFSLSLFLSKFIIDNFLDKI